MDEKTQGLTKPARDQVREQVEAVRTLLDAQTPEITKALVRGIDPAWFIRSVVTACRFNPHLLEIAQTPRGKESLMLGVLHAAALGLEPSTPLGLCFLVPYQGVVSLQIGYKGLVQLAWRSTTPTVVTARVVRERDEYRYEEGLRQVLHHVPKPAAEAGELVAVYAVARSRAAPAQATWLWRDEVERRRALSPAFQRFMRGDTKATPWVEHPEPMWKKSAVKAQAPYLHLSPQFQRALAIDEQPLEPDLPAPEAPRPSPLDVLAGEAEK